MLRATVTIRSNKLPGMDGRLRTAVRDALTKGALDIYAASLPLTPVDTGALRANVTATADGVHWQQEYAAYQEFGTVRGVTPKRYAGQAFERVAPGMVRALSQLEGRLV